MGYADSVAGTGLRTYNQVFVTALGDHQAVTCTNYGEGAAINTAHPVVVAALNDLSQVVITEDQQVYQVEITALSGFDIGIVIANNSDQSFVGAASCSISTSLFSPSSSA